MQRKTLFIIINILIFKIPYENNILPITDWFSLQDPVSIYLIIRSILIQITESDVVLDSVNMAYRNEDNILYHGLGFCKKKIAEFFAEFRKKPSRGPRRVLNKSTS